MNFLDRLKSRISVLLLKGELDADLDAEMRSRIEMRTEQNAQAGTSPEEARCTALPQLGWPASIKETCRDQRGVTCLEIGVRMWLKTEPVRIVWSSPKASAASVTSK